MNSFPYRGTTFGGFVWVLILILGLLFILVPVFPAEGPLNSVMRLLFSGPQPMLVSGTRSVHDHIKKPLTVACF